MKLNTIIICILTAATGAAFAHSGVMNPAVMARMDAMSSIGAQVKVLGQMAKGEKPFDKQAAQKAAAQIAKHASDTPALFKANESDPKSEAKPEIWENFQDFTKKSEDLADIAGELSNSLSTKGDLTSALRRLGANCKSCHTDYRQEK